MADDETNDDGSPMQYEHGIPIINVNARLGEVERKAAAAEARDTQYKNEQVKINRRMAVFTGLLLVTSLISGAISIWQARIANRSANAAQSAAKTASDTLLEIQKGSTDTHELAVQAGTQAGATKDIANNSKNQTSAARQLAENAVKTTRNAEVAFRDEQRAWIGVVQYGITQFESKKDLVVDIQFFNSGKTPAVNVQIGGRYDFSDVYVPSPSTGPLLWHNQAAIAPQGNTVSHVFVHASDVEPWFEGIKARTAFVYISGKIRYEDTASRVHDTSFCLYYMDSSTPGKMAYCERGNDIN